MKLYIKTRNKFFAISIVILSCAFLVKEITLSNFLLGVFASTIIITIQYDLAAKVEEEKLLINRLRKIRDLCFKLDDFNTFSLDYFAYNFENRFYEMIDYLQNIFQINDELGNLYLSWNTKRNLKNILERISELEISLHLIIENFDSQNTKMKIIYFIEFYKILKSFDFENLRHSISEIGWKISSEEFYKDDFKTEKKYKIKHMEYETSLEIYNQKIESDNMIEYKALKSKFEKYMKINSKAKNGRNK